MRPPGPLQRAPGASGAPSTAVVNTDTLSREFGIARGTKQGDPLSSLLFNSLSQYIFQQVYPKWSKRKYGIRLSCVQGTRLTNLRFADAVLLIGGSMTLIKRMISDVRNIALATGLEIHPDKTKILNNLCHRRPKTTPGFTVVDRMNIEVLPFFWDTEMFGPTVRILRPSGNGD